MRLLRRCWEVIPPILDLHSQKLALSARPSCLRRGCLENTQLRFSREHSMITVTSGRNLVECTPIVSQSYKANPSLCPSISVLEPTLTLELFVYHSWLKGKRGLFLYSAPLLKGKHNSNILPRENLTGSSSSWFGQKVFKVIRRFSWWRRCVPFLATALAKMSVGMRSRRQSKRSKKNWSGLMWRQSTQSVWTPASLSSQNLVSEYNSGS